jgi:hypothetical protein
MLTSPKTIGNLTFDRYSLQLAINGVYLPDGSPDASISIVLTPTAITTQGVAQANQGSVQILRGHLSEITDAAEQVALAKVQAALQEFVTAKLG